MIWSLLQQVGGQATNYAVFLLLATLLPPSDFGLVAMAGVWLAALTAFSEVGLGAALIHRRELAPGHLSSTFMINLATGLALAAVGILVSWPVAASFRQPSLQPVMAALSLGFLLRAFGLTHAALAQRQLRFRDLAVRDLVANLAGGIVGISLALSGRGVWSLVGSALVSSAAAPVLLWRRIDWRPHRAEVSWTCVRELWPYGSRVLGFNIFKAMAQNVDRLVLGYALGPQAVGLYAFAWRLVVFPVQTVVGALGQYLFIRSSRAQTDVSAVRAHYLYVTQVALALVLPGLAAVALLAPVLVVPIFGRAWLDAIPVIRWLAGAAVALALLSPVGQLMKGLGRPGWLLGWSVGFTALTAIALLVGARHGLAGAAIGYATAHVIAVPINWIIARRLVQVGLLDMGERWSPLVIASALFAATLSAVMYVAGGAPVALAAAAAVTAAIVVYTGSLIWLSPDLIRAARSRLRHSLQSLSPS